MNTKIAFEMGIVLAVLVVFTAGVASATTYYVPDNYATIQAAVTAASAGDTIIVRDGFYNENVNVNKRLTIESENGSALTTVNASNSGVHVFNVIVDYVNISGFRVTNASTVKGKAGIYLAPNTDHCNISYNNATKNYVGIRLNRSSYNNISHNNASYNDEGSGIGVGRSSHHNTVDNNTVTYNDKNGIGIGMSSQYNIIRDNNASYNEQYGIYINGSNYTEVTYNDIMYNENYGVKKYNSYNCNVYYNNFISNSVPQGGTHQAWDNKDSNNWDDGTYQGGNYWDEWNTPWLDYSIDGDNNWDYNPSGSQF